MMAVSVEQNVERHAQIACHLPRIGAALHQPGRSCVAERVW